ncbi:MAG TPA: hypothetical protein VFA77_02325 [Candidatus Eisenbacteria bacterium]|nr:hypothetical protein [Candidatus Eisenbacteria bacterium]
MPAELHTGNRGDERAAAGQIAIAKSVQISTVFHMSLQQLESAILALPPEDRSRLAIWFDEHRQDLLGGADSDGDLSEEQQAEILRRRDLALAHPELLEPWEGTIERARQRLHELRRQKAANR